MLYNFFRNFGYAEITLHSEMTRKASFSFAFHSFFRNFARFLSFSLISKINPREYPLIKFKGHSFFFFVDKIH